MKLMRFVLFVFLSLPKTLYFNFVALPFKIAYKLPILIGYNVKIHYVHKGTIIFDECKIRTFIFRIGWGGSKVVPVTQKGSISISKGAKLVIKGRTCLAEGSVIDVSGCLVFGGNFSSNKNAFISCSKKIVFSDGVMLGWNVSLFDASGHTVYVNSIPKESQKEIVVGEHVWLCSHSHVMKGAEIGSGSILAWGSVLTKKYECKNVLLAGNPAVVKCENINWGEFVK